MAEEASKRSLIDHFSALKDPRQAWKVIYPLPEIMLLVLCAMLAGTEDFVEARLWGVKKLDFLHRFLPFKDGLPSHDTLNDVINALVPPPSAPPATPRPPARFARLARTVGAARGGAPPPPCPAGGAERRAAPRAGLGPGGVGTGSRGGGVLAGGV